MAAGPLYKAMRASINLHMGAWAVAFALWPSIASADSRPSQQEETVVFSDGLKGRITELRLRQARLAFDDASLSVEVEGEYPERFEYGKLRIRRGKDSERLPLLSKHTWMIFLPSTGVYLAFSDFGSAAVYVAGLLGITHVVYFWDRLFRRNGPHWWSLHSDSQHRCVFLALPRKKRARLAILEELERRDKRELIVRPSGPRRGPRPTGGPVIGETAPDFVTRTIDGSPWSLSQSRGKLTLLNFWATWCEPCRKELPDLERLHQMYSRQGLAVIGVSGENPDDVRNFLSTESITYPALHDRDHQVHHLYQVNAIPTTYVIGRDGTLLKRIEGYASKKALTAAVTTCISQTQGGPDH